MGIRVLQACIIGVADHYTRCAKTCGGDRGKAACCKHRTHLIAQFLLRQFQPVKAVFAGFYHGIAEIFQRVSGHGCVIGVTAACVGVHDVRPCFQVG